MTIVESKAALDRGMTDIRNRARALVASRRDKRDLIREWKDAEQLVLVCQHDLVRAANGHDLGPGVREQVEARLADAESKVETLRAQVAAL